MNKLIPLCFFFLTATLSADVTVNFTNTGANATSIGPLTLDFSINGSGVVSLDASTASTDATEIATINALDSGNVGTISDSSIFNSTFTLVSSTSRESTGTPPLHLYSNDGGTLGVGGHNSGRIDGAGLTTPNRESLHWTAVSSAMLIEFKTISWSNAADSTMLLQIENGPSATNPAGPTPGTWDLSTTGETWILDNSESIDLSTTSSNGYGLAGFSFNITAKYSQSVGLDLSNEQVTEMNGSSAVNPWTTNASDVFGIGSAMQIITTPDNGGTTPIEFNGASLWLEVGLEWVLDGSNYTASFNVGDRFTLANYGAIYGNVRGVRFRNFHSMPANRELKLHATQTSLYFEVVEQMAATGPNIIFINNDDMTAGQFFGFDGQPVLSPTLDSMANNGINFTHAVSSSTVCGPSRYSTITGRYASRNTSAHLESIYPPGTLSRFGVSDTELEDDRENVASWLQQAGYRTGYVGKAHLIDDELVHKENWPSKGLINYPPDVDPKLDADVNAAMKHNHRSLCHYMREYGFDYVNSLYRANTKELESDFLDYHNQEWVTKGALDFIEENHNQRFMIMVGPTVNHGPVRNDLSHSLLADKDYTSAGYTPGLDYSFMPTRQSIINEVNAAGHELKTARQTWLDHSVQAILNKLDEHGIRNNTLIIFTCDHGFDTNLETPVRRGKSSMYDMGLRPPLVMYWPGGITNPGRVYDQLVQNVDFAPTFLELAGVSNLPTRKVDGVSLVDVLNGSSNPVRSETFTELGYAKCIRTKDWKYIAVRYTQSVYDQIDAGFLWDDAYTLVPTWDRPYYTNNGGLGQQSQNTYPNYFHEDQIYDLNADPHEQTNLYGQHPDIAYDLKKRLAKYAGDFPNRPYRDMDDGTIEFGTPAPTSLPSAPTNVQVTYPNASTADLTWIDTANNELGYVVEQSVDGAPYEIIHEIGINASSATVSLSAPIANTVLRVTAYNAYEDSIPMPATFIDRTDEAGAIISDEHNDSAAGFGPGAAFDNDSNTKYLIDHGSGWVQHQFAGNKQYTVQWYSVTSAADAPASSGPNLLSDPSFESGGAWTLTHASASLSSDFAQNGSQSLKLSGTGSISKTHQTISVTPNTDYEVRVWVYNPNQTAGNAVFDLNDKPSPAEEVQFVVTSGAASTWTELVGNFNSGAETSIQVRMFTNAAFAGTIYFDNISFVNPNGGTNAQSMDPSSWTLSGSNNGSSWDVLDSKSGIVFSTRSEKKEFNLLSNNTDYEYYRFDVASSGGSKLQFAEIELFSDDSENADPLQDWLDSNGVTDVNGDDDNDGVDNFTEFALNGNPNSGDSETIGPIVIENGNNFDFSFRREQETVNYVVETSDDLSGWTEFVTNPGVVGQDVTVSIPNTLMVGGKLFVRLNLSN